MEEGFFSEYSRYIAEYKNEITGISILEAIKQKELADFSLIPIKGAYIPKKIDIFEVKEEKNILEFFAKLPRC